MTNPSAPIPVTEPAAGAVARVGAFLVALCILIGGAVFSLGTILFAPLGMAIATPFWRRRGRALPLAGGGLRLTPQLRPPPAPPPARALASTPSRSPCAPAAASSA